MARCGNRWTAESEEDARLGINLAIDAGLTHPVVRLKDGGVYRIVRYHKKAGKKAGRYVVDKQTAKGKFVRHIKTLSTRSMVEAEIDTEGSARQTHYRANRHRYDRQAQETEDALVKLQEDVNFDDAETSNKAMRSVGTIRSDKIGGTRISKDFAFLGKFSAARHLFSKLYSKDGWNIRSKWVVPFDMALDSVERHTRTINNFVTEHAFGHMTAKELEAGKNIMSWLLDGSYMKDIKAEFGRTPTEKEFRAAHMLRVIMGTKKGRGLHGLLNMEGFLGEYLPHMRKWRNIQAEIVQKQRAGEEIADAEWEQLKELHSYGLAGKDAKKMAPNMENMSKLEREFKMEEYEDDILFLLDRYIAAGLKDKYVEPTVRQIEKDFGITFIRATGKFEQGQVRDKVMTSVTKNIGDFEYELLIEHVRSSLYYPTEMEIGLNQKFQAGFSQLQKIVPFMNKMPNGDRTFSSMSGTLASMMYMGALGGRVASALKQLTGFPIVIGELGPKHTTIGLAKLMTNPRQAFQRAADAGLFKEYLPSKERITEDARLQRSKYAKYGKWFMIMFEIADQSQRVIAYEGGLSKARAQKGKLNLNYIRDAGAKNRMESYRAEGDWEALAQEFGLNASHESQFKYGRKDSPMHFRDATGRAMGMFMTWQLYFMGKMGHWATAGFKGEGTKGQRALKGSAHMIRHMAPMFIAMYVLTKMAEEATDTDLSPWFVQMFEAPDAPGPPAKMAYHLFGLANAGMRTTASSLLGSHRVKEREWKQFKRASREVREDVGLMFFGGIRRDVARASEWYDERGPAGFVQGMAGLKPYEESE